MDGHPIVLRTYEELKTEIHLGESQRRLLVRLAPLILGLFIALAVCLPFFRGGYLLLLDLVIGPHTQIIGQSFYGLQGGINSSFLFGLAAGILAHLFGSFATWIPIFIFFPLACMSIARAVKENLVAKLAAGLFFSTNPFVVERVYAGQLGLLYGYLLLDGCRLLGLAGWTRGRNGQSRCCEHRFRARLRDARHGPGAG